MLLPKCRTAFIRRYPGIEHNTILNSMQATPKQVGQYAIEREVGRGGMGIVYQARDTRSNAQVALKLVLRSVDDHNVDDRLAELALEAEVGKRVEHPGLVAIRGYERVEGGALVAMELLDGETLADAQVRGVHFSADVSVSLVKQLADAAASVHAKGIIHRDIKPANIMVLRSGRVKLLDFGVASIDGKTPRRQAGTPAYMAPEQARGERPTPGADVFSLGVVLYELLSGQRPFGSPSFIEVARRQPQATPPLLREGADQSILGPVAPIIARALAGDPNQRFGDAGMMRDALEQLTHVRQSAPIALRTIGTPSADHRQRAIRLGAGLATLIVAVSAGALYLLEGQEPRQQRDELSSRGRQSWTAQQSLGSPTSQTNPTPSPSEGTGSSAGELIAPVQSISSSVRVSTASLEDEIASLSDYAWSILPPASLDDYFRVVKVVKDLRNYSATARDSVVLNLYKACEYDHSFIACHPPEQ
jgi:serine/threonine protein kinase